MDRKSRTRRGSGLNFREDAAKLSEKKAQSTQSRSQFTPKMSWQMAKNVFNLPLRDIRKVIKEMLELSTIARYSTPERN